MNETRFLPDFNDCKGCATYGSWDCSRHAFDKMMLKRQENGDYIRGSVAGKPVFIVDCWWHEKPFSASVKKALTN